MCAPATGGKTPTTGSGHAGSRPVAGSPLPLPRRPAIGDRGRLAVTGAVTDVHDQPEVHYDRMDRVQSRHRAVRGVLDPDANPYGARVALLLPAVQGVSHGADGRACPLAECAAGVLPRRRQPGQSALAGAAAGRSTGLGPACTTDTTDLRRLLLAGPDRMDSTAWCVRA